MIELLADDLSLWHFYCYTCYPEYGVVALVFPLHFVPALGCWTLILDDPGTFEKNEIRFMTGASVWRRQESREPCRLCSWFRF